MPGGLDDGTEREAPSIHQSPGRLRRGGVGVVDIISFVVSTYELSRTIVDIAMLLAVSGGVATAIITWTHGKPGTRRFSRKEKTLLGLLGVLTIAGAFKLISPNPTKRFHRLDGRRLVVEFPLPPPELVKSLEIRWAPPSRSGMFSGGVVVDSPEEFRANLPGVSVWAQAHPVKFEGINSAESGFLTFVLPDLPADALFLLENGPQHDSALIESGGLSIQIQRPVSVRGNADSLTVRVEGRFSGPSGTSPAP